MRNFLTNSILMIAAIGLVSLSQAGAGETGGIWDTLLASSSRPASYHSGGCDSSGCEAVSCDGGCDSSCGSASRCVQGWSASLDALFLNRDAASNLGGAGLVSRGGFKLLDNDDLNPSTETGYRIGVMMHRNSQVHYEATYFGNDWDTSRSLVDPNRLDSVLGTLDYTLADRIDVRYESEIDNVELNRWKNLTRSFSWMLGFRYISLDEAFDLTGTDGSFSSNYSIDTENDLYGAQIGAKQFARVFHDSVDLSVLGKVGVFGNDASQKARLQDINGTFNTRDFANSDGTTSFVGEINANATIWLYESLAVRTGYQLMWIDSVALAPEQFQQSSLGANAALNNSGDLFINGAYVGIELQW